MSNLQIRLDDELKTKPQSSQQALGLILHLPAVCFFSKW